MAEPLPGPNDPYPFPIAPTQDEWDRLSERERAQVVEDLPTASAFEFASDGSLHFKSTSGAVDLLETWFRKRGRAVFVAGNMGVHYPGERLIAPDVLVVFDVDPHPRTTWVVSKEGKGLDWVLEVHAHGKHHKDIVANPVRYARLGIPEYFVFDLQRGLIHGHRLLDPTARKYVPVIPQGGVWFSEQLGLGLQVEQGRLRFSFEGNPVLDSIEQVERLQMLVDDLVTSRINEEQAREQEELRRAEDIARRAFAEQQAEEERLLRLEEQRRREQVEAELAALRAELEKLKGR